MSLGKQSDLVEGAITPVPVGSLSDSAAFIRDPAVFTGFTGRKLGDYYRLRVPAYHLRVVTHPAVIEEVLVTCGPSFIKSKLYWGELRRIIGEAMASLEGARWRYLRHLQQPFFTPRAAASYMDEASALTTDELDELAHSVGSGREYPVLDIVSRLNTRLVLALLFGQRGGAERLEIAHRIVDGEATIAWRSKFPWRALTGWLNGRNQAAERHKAFFDDYASRVSRSEAADRNDLLVGALEAMRRSPDAPDFPTSLLRNEMIVHLGASTETQGVAEGWCLYLLWKNPDVLRRMRAEIDDVAGSSLVGIEHVPSLTYTLQVIRETLRLYPTAYAVVRDCAEPTRIQGEPVTPGQVFFISLVGLHRSPRFWPDPDRFDPERFTEERFQALPRHQYMPFGGGRQVCIGQHIALPTMLMAIAQFAQRFDWTFQRGDIQPVGLATLKPRGSFRAVLRPRVR